MKYIILLCGLLFFTGCTHSFTNITEETIVFELPAWPPEDNCSTKYPELSQWIITTCNSTKTEKILLPAGTKSFTSTVNRNLPYCILALPLTKTAAQPDSELSYFYPAGFIYPFFLNPKSSSQLITWSQGYLANAMLTIIKSKDETGVSTEHMDKYISTFNWKKAQETIDKKIEKSISEDSETLFYNPWLIDTTQLLSNICYGNFKSSNLNITGCFGLKLKLLNINQQEEILSAFIPENINLHSALQISIKKGIPTLLSDAKTFGIIITAQSEKKMSKEIINLPIYLTEI